jgi:urease accessory protein
MQVDAEKARAGRPFVFTDLKSGRGVDEIVSYLTETGGLQAA